MLFSKHWKQALLYLRLPESDNIEKSQRESSAAIDRYKEVLKRVSVGGLTAGLSVTAYSLAASLTAR